MNEELLNKIERLNSALKASKEYEELKEFETRLDSNDEVKILSYKKDVAISKYEDALRHYEKNSKEVLDASKEMSEAIFALNNHQVVKAYMEKYEAYNAIINEINKSLFDFYEVK